MTATDARPATLAARRPTQRLVRTVDGLDDDALGGSPALLPGWTRAHVVAHLALNAEGLAGALRGRRRRASRRRCTPPQEARDADIDELPRPTAGRAARPAAGRRPPTLADAVAAVPDDAWADRRSSGRPAAARSRRAAVARHAAARGRDPPRRPRRRLHRRRLAGRRSPSTLLDAMAKRRRRRTRRSRVRATDLDRHLGVRRRAGRRCHGAGRRPGLVADRPRRRRRTDAATTASCRGSGHGDATPET